MRKSTRSWTESVCMRIQLEMMLQSESRVRVLNDPAARVRRRRSTTPITTTTRRSSACQGRLWGGCRARRGQGGAHAGMAQQILHAKLSTRNLNPRLLS
jgi:hypothetical protein